jgi:hypothetical protein
MQQPAKGIGQGIIRVNGSPYVAQNHFPLGHPFLQGKLLDAGAATVIHGEFIIGYNDGICIILIQLSGFQFSDGDL